MNPRFMDFYQQELRFIREMGAEYASRYPKIAGGLDLGGMECADPYVERLLEGFAFLTARIQLKLAAEFPGFTQHLLEIVYPHYLAPTPAMALVQFNADLKGGVTESGFVLPRHTELRSNSVGKGRTSCEFRTAHEVKLWPLRLSEASYVPPGGIGRYTDSRSLHQGAKSGLRICLETVAGFAIRDLDLNSLPVYLHGMSQLPTRLYELMMGRVVGVVAQPGENSPKWQTLLDKRTIRALGFEQGQAMLPYGEASFQGYRLLQEYFAMPQRYLFVDLCGLQPAIKRCENTSLEIILLLDTEAGDLEDLVSTENFKLFCAPAINLFPKRADRIHLNHRSTEHHVVVDRTRPRDFEVYAVNGVTGFSSGSTPEQIFRPFYSIQDEITAEAGHAYYTLHRRPALEPLNGNRTRSPYPGSEVYVSLVDSIEAPYRHSLKQLGIDTLCTNRDLPQLILPGQGNTDFTLDIGAPVDAIRCLAGPTDPKPSQPEGESAWRLISHLSFNYLSLLDEDEARGATALREMLRLYGDLSEPSIKKQIEGLLTVSHRPVVRRIPIPGPMSFGRGVEINVNLDESAFEGIGAFLLGAVLERFFARYVSINSYTQTVVTTRERGEIMRWPVRTGTRTLM